MPFRYRLQKILDVRIRDKEKQLQEVRKAQAAVVKIEGLIERNNKEIAQTRIICKNYGIKQKIIEYLGLQKTIESTIVF